MAWRLAGSLVTLRTQINATWPDRSKVSDGTIASRQHSIQNPTSDHEPNAQGVVTAFDCTHDPTSADMRLVAEALRQSQDRRIKYVIWDRRIFSSYSNSARNAWEWGDYSGSNPHTSHMHVSVSADPSLYDRTDAWTIGDIMGFTDLDGLPQEAVDAINRLTEQGILNGTSATTFDPYTPMTRAQVAMVIDRIVNPQ